MKISSSLKETLKQHIASSDLPFFSAEFFPPQTVEGIKSVISRIENVREGNPMFCDITWHGTGNPEGKGNTSSLSIAKIALNICGLETMSHITCVSVNKQELDAYLQKLKQIGIRNILVLRGDVTSGNERRRDFKYAADMVRYIREKHGDHFTLGVGGYPAKHPEATSYADDIAYLKNKVDCGADFIITQFFFESDEYIRFVNDCRQVGIKVPIIAGIMPIQSFASLKKLISICSLKAPKHILETLESISDNKIAVKKFGIDFAVNVCEAIIRSGLCPGFHFYTLNNESSTITVLKKLGLWKRSVPRLLPWRTIPSSKRYKERVRPIFWSNRMRSYLYRTSDWLIYPENKWNDYIPQVYKDLDDYFYKYLDNHSSAEQLRNLWGNELNSLSDVCDVFSHYFSEKENENGIKVTKTAWTQNKFDYEMNFNSEKLTTISEQGFLPINFQSNLNGVDSSEETVGWGPRGGFIYRKAYLEFFTSRQNAMILKDLLPKYELVNYNMISSDETENYTNCDEDKAIAINWAVFSGQPIIQPIVADPISFKVWKNEAFSLWNEWAQVYEEESKSRRLLEYISNDYFLVYLIDNNFQNECCFWKLLEEVHLIAKYSE